MHESKINTFGIIGKFLNYTKELMINVSDKKQVFA